MKHASTHPPHSLWKRIATCATLALSVLVTVSCGSPDAKKEASASETLGLLDNDCYAPTKNVTKEDKIAWIKKAAPFAINAEKKFGTPAAAILAMTSAEGGYGFTRTAINANNPFGWKGSASSAEGRGLYTLTCQPAEDKGNVYVKFWSFEDAIMFVGEQLATKVGWGAIANYKAATDRYVKDRQSGVDSNTAVNRWIDGVADAKYNYDPPTYKRTLKNLANNYVTASSTLSGEFNTYQYSRNIMPKSGAGSGGTSPTNPTPPAAGAFIVNGLVQTSSGTPLADATVTLDSRITKTSGTGYYEFKNVTAGTHTVTAAKDGYKGLVKEEQLNAAIWLNLTLTK